MKVLNSALCLILVTLLLASGCRSAPEPVRPPPQGAAPPPGLWGKNLLAPAEDPRTRPKFIPAEDARQCPMLQVQTLEGEARQFLPARVGGITLVVFWSMDVPATRAAGRYAADLSNIYGKMGLQVVGIVEKTVVPARTPEGQPIEGQVLEAYKYAPAFMTSQGMRYPVFYDDFTALRAMAKAAREKVGNDAPMFFLVDRQQRVRFSKLGFSFVGGMGAWSPGGWGAPPQLTGEALIEIAADGEHIRDYIEKLLKEQ